MLYFNLLSPLKDEWIESLSTPDRSETGYSSDDRAAMNGGDTQEAL
jgi:hypothetical protein